MTINLVKRLVIMVSEDGMRSGTHCFEGVGPWGLIVCFVLLTLLGGCATSSSIGEIDAKLMARNFLHGRADVKRAPGVRLPDVPYRYMTDFRAENVSGNELAVAVPAGRSLWSVRIRVTDGEYSGMHRVIIDPVSKEVLAWKSNVS